MGICENATRCSMISARRSLMTSCAALPAASQDRWRGVRLRGLAQLASSKTRARVARDVHSTCRAERHDRRDRRMDVAPSVSAKRPPGRYHCRSASIFRRSSSVTATCPAWFILMDTGLAAIRLELEITEGVLINDAPRALTILRRLKLLGLKIAMDDFGTGFASLQSFPSTRSRSTAPSFRAWSPIPSQRKSCAP
jgi:EAL domain